MFKITRIHVFLLLLILLFSLQANKTVHEYFENKIENKPKLNSNSVLKTEIVPPVCPKCPDVIQTCEKYDNPPPCPPCARCPKPDYECKMVPKYNKKWNSNTSGLPRPFLDTIYF